jgi:hypothetical protein
VLLAVLAVTGAPAPAAAGTSVATIDAQVRTTAATVTVLQHRLAALSARLTRAGDRVARLDSQLRWSDGALSRSGPATLGLRAAVIRRDAQRRALASATRTLSAIESQSADHPVLVELVAAEKRLQRLTALRRRALASLSPPAAATLSSPAMTRGAWAASLLGALGAPSCRSNLTAVVSWEAAENTGAAWNPLATTLPAPESVAYNHARVQGYPTSGEGLAATVDTLRLGYYSHGYGWIVYRLSQCAPAAVTAQAINASDWCRGCAKGSYVTDMLPDVAADYVDSALLPVARPVR